jgi:hypothetical protein
LIKIDKAKKNTSRQHKNTNISIIHRGICWLSPPSFRLLQSGKSLQRHEEKKKRKENKHFIRWEREDKFG